jgi:toxin HigB-1
MDISFSNDKLKDLCEQQRLATKELGAACAGKLRSRLADLSAAANVSELNVGRPHPLKGDRAGQFSLELAGGKRLVFEPANEPVPRREDKSIDWSLVTKARVIYVGDYHE